MPERRRHELSEAYQDRYGGLKADPFPDDKVSRFRTKECSVPLGSVRSILWVLKAVFRDLEKSALWIELRATCPTKTSLRKHEGHLWPQRDIKISTAELNVTNTVRYTQIFRGTERSALQNHS